MFYVFMFWSLLRTELFFFFAGKKEVRALSIAAVEDLLLMPAPADFDPVDTERLIRLKFEFAICSNWSCEG